MRKGDHIADPRGLIFEAYRIENATDTDCRTIFLDWALGVPEGQDMQELLGDLRSHYGTRHPDHPMTAVLDEGLGKPSRASKRRGRFSRRKDAGQRIKS